MWQLGLTLLLLDLVIYLCPNRPLILLVIRIREFKSIKRNRYYLQYHHYGDHNSTVRGTVGVEDKDRLLPSNPIILGAFMIIILHLNILSILMCSKKRKGFAN